MAAAAVSSGKAAAAAAAAARSAGLALWSARWLLLTIPRLTRCDVQGYPCPMSNERCGSVH